MTAGVALEHHTPESFGTPELAGNLKEVGPKESLVSESGSCLR